MTVYPTFAQMRNLARQHTTPKSDANATMERNKPANAPYRTFSNGIGWMTQEERGRIRHEQDILNSIKKREEEK